jgi:membrane-associated phospholipid phosphatase
MAGGHFLSDVLIAWLLVLLVLLLCHRLFMRALPPGFDDSVEGALARAGRGLRRLVGA